jgi:predicted Zn-dependent protease
MIARWIYILLLLSPPLSALAAGTEPPELNILADEPNAPFDNDRYLLGYQVYLARGNLPAAYFVARKAIHNQTNNPDWLKRFAQVAEWVGQPSEALDAWLKYAQKTNNKAAWDAVGRLASGLLNDEDLLV